MANKRYTEEQKIQAVAKVLQAIDEGSSPMPAIKSVAQDIGAAAKTVESWYDDEEIYDEAQSVEIRDNVLPTPHTESPSFRRAKAIALNLLRKGFTIDTAIEKWGSYGITVKMLEKWADDEGIEYPGAKVDEPESDAIVERALTSYVRELARQVNLTPGDETLFEELVAAAVRLDRARGDANREEE